MNAIHALLLLRKRELIDCRDGFGEWTDCEPHTLTLYRDIKVR